MGGGGGGSEDGLGEAERLLLWTGSGGISNIWLAARGGGVNFSGGITS